MPLDATLEQKLDLALRGLHLLIRTSYSPNDPGPRVQHFAALQRDIGPWLQDYVSVMQPPQPESN